MKAHRCVERLPSQCRAQVHPGKARLSGGKLTGAHETAADATSRPVGMHIEGPNVCGVTCGIEQRISFPLALIASIQGLALAPPSGSNDLTSVLGDVICAILD